MDDIGISTYLSTKQCDIKSRALHWVFIPMPMPMPTRAQGSWVGMGAILLVMLQFEIHRRNLNSMGGHGWAHVMLWVGIGRC